MSNATYSSRAFAPAKPTLGALLAELFAVTPLAILLNALKAAPKATKR